VSTLRQRLAAEWLGKFALVFAGTGAVTRVGIALTFGTFLAEPGCRLVQTPGCCAFVEGCR